MSPDPPRSEEELSSGTIYFMQGPDDEDFMDDPNGEHVLDFSDHESDFTDDDDVDNNNGERRGEEIVNNPVNDSEEPPQRMMARYQLLIPFPPAENNLEYSETEESEIIDTQPPPQQESQPESNTLNSDDPSSVDIPNSKDETKREIVLTDDKVEIIKNAMKNFTLTSIPPWAEEIDENSWKEKLFDSIPSKS